MRQPKSTQKETTEDTIAGLPWQDISIISSPVYEFGPEKRVTTTSSRGSPSGVTANRVVANLFIRGAVFVLGRS